MSIVDLHNIHRSMAKGKEVLHGVDLSIEPGEVVALLGSNGAGKTTLLRIAMGLLLPHQGSVKLFGRDFEQHALSIKRRVGYVSEDQVLPSYLTVEGILSVHRALFPTWDTALETRLRNRFSLSGRTKINDLSKGEKRQVALLCAISHRPELLILDEPASGLDPAARRNLIEVAIEALSDGATLLFSSHHMQDVERLAARVALIHEGNILVDQPLDKLREDSTLLTMPATDSAHLEVLCKVHGYLGSRNLGGNSRALFLLNRRDVAASLESHLDLKGAVYSKPSLEDFFVEAVEGQP